MSKKSFSAAAEAAVQALLNAQKVDASIITDECGNVAIRKAPLNDVETICEVQMDLYRRVRQQKRASFQHSITKACNPHIFK